MLYSIQDQNQPENIYLLKVFDVSDIFSLLLPPVGAGQVSAQFYILSPLCLWVSLCPSPLLSLSSLYNSATPVQVSELWGDAVWGHLPPCYQARDRRTQIISDKY